MESQQKSPTPNKKGPVDWVTSLKKFIDNKPSRLPEEIEKETDEEFLKIM